MDDKKMKNTRALIIAAIVVVLVIIVALAAFFASQNANTEKYEVQLEELLGRANDLEENAEAPYRDGSLGIDDYEAIVNLGMKADDTLTRLQNGTCKVKEAKKAISELEEDLDKYEKLLADLGTSSRDEEEDTQEPETETAEAQTETAEPESETTTAALTDTVDTLIANVQEFQNECSRRHDLGEITEEQYMDILQLEIEAAQVMESMKAGGDPDDLDKQADELSAKMYDEAVKVNSPLADNFKE